RSVAACIDTSHTTLGHHWDRFIQTIGRRIAHVHLSDHRGHCDDHLPPGEGIIDWRRVCGSLRQVDFDGWLVLEVACPEEAVSPYFDLVLRRARTLFGD